MGVQVSSDRPKQFNMSVQGGMLEALGINMYSSLGKCLVEFIANAYDADAPHVEITIPFEAINKARADIRKIAKQEIKKGKREPFSLLTLPIAEDIEVIIKDTGHGMTPDDIEKKFLPFNRNRRFDEETKSENNRMSEGGRRKVMGRKGLGKLAGFGAAEVVVIKTKRLGLDYATTIRLDYAELNKNKDISSAPIEAVYTEGLPLNESWTEIRLMRLKCDAVKFGQDTLMDTLTDNFFGIDPRDFNIILNRASLLQPYVPYDFLYPTVLQDRDFAEDYIEIDDLNEIDSKKPDLGKIKFKYVVKFRQRRDNLGASKRGARIYCSNRLAAGPSLFTLPSGMHGFHNISYMECIVKADEFDNITADLINTNRTQLKEDNEAVSKLIDKVVEHMKAGVAAYTKFRDEKAGDDIEKSSSGKLLLKLVDRMPAKTKKSARALLTKLSSEYGAESDEFNNLAPLVIDTMNAGEVLIRLVELGTDPQTISHVANALHELADIEKSDALKLYRGRRDGIRALTQLTNRGNDLWGRMGIENELHALLKQAPWLIRPEFGRFLTSDTNLDTVYGRIASELEIDGFARSEDATKDEEKKKRPDLIFVMGSSQPSQSEIIVVELKSPTIPLTIDHLAQLKSYMNRIEDWCVSNLGKLIPVRGYLIGQRAPSESKAEGPYQLRKEEEKKGIDAMWAVCSMEQLLEAALLVHLTEIDTLEDELPDENVLKAATRKRA